MYPNAIVTQLSTSMESQLTGIASYYVGVVVVERAHYIY